MSEVQVTVEYRNINGLPGYRVGDDGSIWSCLVRRVRHKENGDIAGTTFVPDPERWRRMKPRRNGTKTKKRYLQIKIGGKRDYVHRIVLTAFVGPCPDGMEGCHFPDPDYTNCRLSNLRWATPENNYADRVAHGTHNKGERHGNAKLTDSIVRLIRAEHGLGVSCKQLAIKFNICLSSLHQIVRRHSWKHVT